MNAALNEDGQINLLTAKPQIYHAINYLANYFVRFLPTAKCLLCGKKLVSNLKKENKNYQAMMPERCFCGHWFHYGCLDEMIIEPPFTHECPHDGCKETLASNNFSANEQAVKEREKRWTQEQSKKGEEASIDKLFGF